MNKKQKDFDKFEEKIVSVINSNMPELRWKKTKATRDGNKDAISQIRHGNLACGFDAWLEVKFRANPIANINSRAFDSTLISATEEERLKALYLATNANINKSLRFRVQSFCARNLTQLSTIRIWDGTDVKQLIEGSLEKKVSDFIIYGIFVVNPLDYSNHILKDERFINDNYFYHLVFAIFNPFPTADDITLGLDTIDIKTCHLKPGWNFPSFVFRPNELEINKGEVALYLKHREKLRALPKQINVIKSGVNKLYYKMGEDLSDAIHSKYQDIRNRIIRSVYMLITGAAGTGKTHIMEQAVAQWSNTHELFSVSFGLSEEANSTSLASIIDFVFDTLAYNDQAHSADDKQGFDALIREYKTHSISKRFKAIFLDDWQKLSISLKYELGQLVKLIKEKSENISIIVFSRPDFSLKNSEDSFRDFLQYQLRGPTKEDIRHNLKAILETQPSDEEISLTKELTPTLVHLIWLMESLKKKTEKKTNLFEYILKLRDGSLFDLPTLTKKELDALSIIYLLPSGLSETLIEKAEICESTIYSLLENGLIKWAISKEVFYYPIHDLWRDSVLRKYKLVSIDVVRIFKKLAAFDHSIFFTYLATSIVNSTSLKSSVFERARTERDKGIDNTKFNEVRLLADAIISSPFHTTAAIEKIADPQTAYIIASDFHKAGDVFTHCSYNQLARESYIVAQQVSDKFLYYPAVEDLALRIRAELTNLDYWNFKLEFLQQDDVINTSKEMSLERVIAISTIMSRKMMGLYLLDKCEQARKLKTKIIRLSTKYSRNSYKGNLLMDSAKNEIIYSPTKAISGYRKAIVKFKEGGTEKRRMQVAYAQLEGLKIKLGKGSYEKLWNYIQELKSSGYFQEYINSMLDMATIYAFNGDCKKAYSLLNEIDSHPDFGIRPRQIFKHKQCKGVIAYWEKDKDNYIDSWKMVQNALKHVGDSYRKIPQHNLNEFDATSLQWYFAAGPMKKGGLYLDPRLW